MTVQGFADRSEGCMRPFTKNFYVMTWNCQASRFRNAVAKLVRSATQLVI